MSSPEFPSQQLPPGRYLTFSLGPEEYAIPLLSVREVIAVPETTPIPFAPPYFLGLMNLRGLVISVIDARLKLGLKPQENPENAIIICELGTHQIGLLVDAVNAVITTEAAEMSPPPEIQGSRSSEYLCGVFRHSDRLILLIDIAKTLNGEDRKALSQNRKAAA